jgi:signal transduction histidine kinase
MKGPLHILHLEDDPDDAALVQSALEGDGVACAVTRVENQADFVAALERGGIDLILSDFSLPGFDGLAAVEIVRTRWPDVPLIMVSGTLGEERAIDALKNGATDYVLKERLARLAPAVRRAMQEVDERSERHRLEARAIDGQKMEVIGQLAGGVAHDFNNILAVITLCSELMLRDLGADDPLRKLVVQIRHAAERAVGLTRQLLVFSRNETVQPVVLDVNEVVKDMDKMLQRLIGENIAMTVSPGKGAWHVKADPGYVGQVLMNLVINARDAMPNGGKLTIATSNVTHIKNGASPPPDAQPGDFVLLAVSDTGTGMTNAVKAHLFEAFFTTKPKGKGTGLGLTTCQTIARLSGGHIGVRSELGQGTTFNVYFPRVELPLAPALASLHPSPVSRGTETLLLVEDDSSVRHLARAVLEDQGYQVLSASNGQEALRVARENRGAPVRLVVTDVIMPLMGGKVMAEWLKTSYPDLKILFTSGHTDDAIVKQGVLEPGIAFLPKPYTATALTHKVREMLDRLG